MPYTTLVAGTTITASWANASVRDQVVTPFATAAARTSAISSPVTGMLSHRADGFAFEGYDGTGWVLAAQQQVFCRKTADESLSSTTTLQNDDALLWAVRTGAVYIMHLWVLYNSGTTPDFKLGFSVPAGTTMAWGWFGSDPTPAVVNAGPYSESSSTAAGGIGANQWLHAHGFITTAGTAGNVNFQWAQNTSDGTSTTVRAGSYGYLARVA